MADGKGEMELQGLYGAVLGGLGASVLGVAVFWGLTRAPQSVQAYMGLIAALIGLTFTGVFMVGGLYAIGSARWVASMLLFAAGFTGLWSVSASLAAEPRPVALAALGVVVAIGVVTGSRRLGSGPKPAPETAVSDGFRG
jgi:hypothetical protein